MKRDNRRKPLEEYTVVLTDTFCGEKNYGWVYRTTVRARSVRGALRAARKHWYKPGTRGRYNVQLGEWTPFGSHTVIYIEGEF